MKTTLAAIPLLALGLAAHATPGVEVWKPLSTTAQMTGEIRLSPSLLQTRQASLPLAVAADVPAFRADTGTYPARILRVTRPANPKLGAQNRFCTAPVRWIVVWRDGAGMAGTLGMAVFSGRAQPASIDAQGLCATFAYTR